MGFSTCSRFDCWTGTSAVLLQILQCTCSPQYPKLVKLTPNPIGTNFPSCVPRTQPFNTGKNLWVDADMVLITLVSLFLLTSMILLPQSSYQGVSLNWGCVHSYCQEWPEHQDQHAEGKEGLSKACTTSTKNSTYADDEERDQEKLEKLWRFRVHRQWREGSRENWKNLADNVCIRLSTSFIDNSNAALEVSELSNLSKPCFSIVSCFSLERGDNQVKDDSSAVKNNKLNGKPCIQMKPMWSSPDFHLRSFARQVFRHSYCLLPYLWGILISFHI
jgi:hypothetical protein